MSLLRSSLLTLYLLIPSRPPGSCDSLQSNRDKYIHTWMNVLRSCVPSRRPPATASPISNTLFSPPLPSSVPLSRFVTEYFQYFSHHFTVMQPLKPGKDNHDNVSRYYDIQLSKRISSLISQLPRPSGWG